MQNSLTMDTTYDFSRFDTRAKSASKTAKKDKTKKETEVATKKPVISGFALVSWIVCMTLLVAMAYSYMVRTETFERSAKLRNEIAALREDTQMLEIKKEQLYGSQKLQEIAVNQLGMQKIQKSQITYVNTNTGDYTEVKRTNVMKGKDSTILTGIARGFNSVIEYLN